MKVKKRYYLENTNNYRTEYTLRNMHIAASKATTRQFSIMPVYLMLPGESKVSSLLAKHSCVRQVVDSNVQNWYTDFLLKTLCCAWIRLET
jgi:hypothetical protein